MTIAQALAKFRFRMEDPDAEKWNVGAETQIFDIFAEAQLIAINLFIDAKKLEHLRALQSTQSSSMSGGSTALPSDFFRATWLKGSDDNFYPLFEEPPKTTKRTTDFLEEDLDTAYGYIFSGTLFLQGFTALAGSWELGYIKEPVTIDANNQPILGQHGNNLTIAISTWIAWGLERQFDRQQEVEQQIMKIFGVNLNGVRRSNT